MTRKRLFLCFFGLCSVALILFCIRYSIGKAYFNAGERLWGYNRYAEALPYYKGALRYLPRDMGVRSRLSLMYEKLGLYEKDIALIKDTLKFAKSAEDMLGWKSDLASDYILTSHFSEAEGLAQELMVAFPDEPNGFMGLASIRGRQGRYEEAVSLAQKALENLLKRYPFGYIEHKTYVRARLAYYHLALNQITEAVRVIQDGIAQVPMQTYLENRGSPRPQPVRPLVVLLACAYEFRGSTAIAEETWKEVLTLSEKASDDALVTFAKERLQTLPRGPLLQPHKLPPIDSLAKQFE